MISEVFSNLSDSNRIQSSTVMVVTETTSDVEQKQIILNF